MYDRKEMEEIIKSNLSVMYKGTVYSKIEDLPSEAELAEGDEVATKAVSDSIDEQIEKLQAEKKKLTPKQEATKKVVDKLNEQGAKDTTVE